MARAANHFQKFLFLTFSKVLNLLNFKLLLILSHSNPASGIFLSEQFIERSRNKNFMMEDFREWNSRRQYVCRRVGRERREYITEERSWEDVIMVLDLKSLLSNTIPTKLPAH